MSKLARFKGKAKSLAKRGGEKAMSTGAVGDVLELGTMALCAVATKQMGDKSPLPVPIDTAGVVVGLGMMMIGKGGTRRAGRRIAKGAAGAMIARAVYGTTAFTIVSGPDGSPRVEVTS